MAKTPSSDELEAKRMFGKQSFTFDQYIEAVVKRKNEMKDRPWYHYNAFDHHDPHSVQMHCLYDMMRHIMWKLTDNLHDIDQMAYIESGWDAAADEMEANYWKLGKSEKVEAEEDKFLDDKDR